MDDQISRIKNEQLEDGSFPDSRGRGSALYTSLILCALDRCTEDVDDIQKKAAAYLLSQKNDDWNFNEDTSVNFFILGTLARYDREIIDGNAIAKILTGLVALESQEGGPYFSRNSAGKLIRAIDPLANAAIAHFLSALEVELPSLQPFGGRLETVECVMKEFCLETTAAMSAVFSFSNSVGGKADGGKKRYEGKDSKPDESERQMMDRIMLLAEKRFSGLENEFRQFAMEGIRKTIDANRDRQMSLMAYYMKQALGTAAEGITDDAVAEMGLANIFFWTAFVIYDDFWDGDEAADPRMLPLANLYARHFVDYFSTLLAEKKEFRDFFHKLMDDLDGANNWETIHCRTKVEGMKFSVPEKLPDYGDYRSKYRPASGHILGPVAMLVSLGCALDSSEVINLSAYFKNYLIAMQLNDDAHDWEEDMKRGHISTVVAMLLEDLDFPGREIDLCGDLPELRRVFWFKTIGRAAETAILHTEKARRALRAMTIVENMLPLEKFIKIPEEVARKAIREQKESLDFLQTYGA